MKRVGFFGGSFDPIHFGHIGLAIYFIEEHGLDEILFCPAACSPFKTKTPPLASEIQRLEMLELSCDHPKFKITTIELDRGGASYTIDTIKALALPGLQLLLSEEAAQGLDLWKDAEELKLLAPPLVGPRSRAISSTEIRDRLKKNLYCSHLVPGKALDYIRANGLYLPKK